MLEIRGLEAGYGALKVLRGIGLSVPAGKVVALLGGNGAGKTTTMKTIVGVVRASAGEIELAGERIERLASHAIFARGLALVPQGRELFPEMSVYENLELGALARRAGTGRFNELLDQVFDHFPRLSERRDQRAGSLSGGEQQMLATGRALMSGPKVLLLDEPTNGLDAETAAWLAATLRAHAASGGAAVVATHDEAFAASCGDETVWMRGGRLHAG